MTRSPRRKKKARTERSKARARPQSTQRGWRTTDGDEIALRVWRAERESMRRIERLSEVDGPFDSYRVTSMSGERYVVEIRSLDAPVNSCECRSCPDCLATPAFELATR